MATHRAGKGSSEVEKNGVVKESSSVEEHAAQSEYSLVWRIVNYMYKWVLE